MKFIIEGEAEIARQKFEKKHRKHHAPHHTISYQFQSGGGIGWVVKVFCTACGKMKDITDYGAW
jgi:hypothetical protein